MYFYMCVCIYIYIYIYIRIFETMCWRTLGKNGKAEGRKRKRRGITPKLWNGSRFSQFHLEGLKSLNHCLSSFRNALCKFNESVLTISTWGSQIAEPLLMFISKCPLQVQMLPGLGSLFQIELLWLLNTWAHFSRLNFYDYFYDFQTFMTTFIRTTTTTTTTTRTTNYYHYYYCYYYYYYYYHYHYHYPTFNELLWGHICVHIYIYMLYIYIYIYMYIYVYIYAYIYIYIYIWGGRRNPGAGPPPTRDLMKEVVIFLFFVFLFSFYVLSFFFFLFLFLSDEEPNERNSN